MLGDTLLKTLSLHCEINPASLLRFVVCPSSLVVLQKVGGVGWLSGEAEEIALVGPTIFGWCGLQC